jgi:hypothetical protein
MRIKQQTSTESPQDDSFIRDNTARQKPFSLDEILKKLPVTLTTSAGNTATTDDTSSDFILTLGNNLAQDLNFEEDSIDDFKKSEDDNTLYPTNTTP